MKPLQAEQEEGEKFISLGICDEFHKNMINDAQYMCACLRVWGGASSLCDIPNRPHYANAIN